MRSLLFACLLAVPLAAAAQSTVPPLNDPANLAGERVSAPSLADDLPINHGAAALEQLLRKLRTRASMMLIVAHPDDEDGGLLTYESRGVGARVAMLTLTRGEGGQNLMSGDFDDALGLIRTQELLAEDRYTGVDQMFGTEVDFGFSKTKEESFRKWTHDRVLYDAVRAVRMYRPLVVASVFMGAPTDGHGQHQVSGQIAQEVFKAAADPNVFPEMIKNGLLPWAPLKVYARVPFSRVTADGMFDYATGRTIPIRFENYVTGVVSTVPPVATVTIHEGDTPQIAAFHGLSYVQWARQGLALQKSQIGGGFRVPPAGVVDVGYKLMGTRLDCTRLVAGQTVCPLFQGRTGMHNPESFQRPLPATERTLFEGIDTSLSGIADLAASDVEAGFGLQLPVSQRPEDLHLRERLKTIDALIGGAQARLDLAHPEAVAAPLRQALMQMDKLMEDTAKVGLDQQMKANVLHELRVKRVQLNNALVLALGLTLEPMTKPLHTTYADPLKTSDKTFYANARLTNDGSQSVKLLELHPYAEAGSLEASSLKPGGSRFQEVTETGLAPRSATRPFFSRPNIEQPYYDIAVAALRNAPATPSPLVASAIVEDLGVRLELRAVVPDAYSLIASHASASDRARTGPPLLEPAVIIPPVSVKLGRATGMPPLRVAADQKSHIMAYQSLQSGSGILPTNTSSVELAVLLGVDAPEPTILGPGRIGLGKIPITVHAPTGWQVSSAKYETADTTLEHFMVSSPWLNADATYRFDASAHLEGKAYTESWRPVGYPGLPHTNYFEPSSFRAVAVNVKTTPGLKIAYVRGTGDDVPDFLSSLGVLPDPLDVGTLCDPAKAVDLSGYDEIVLGVRAYSAHPELSGAGSKPLLDYARGGGIVVVQYNSGGFNPASAPYPYELPGDSAHNVVEEDQPVRVLAPDAPLLTWPNKITATDFNGWVAERGHGFASTWAPEYMPLVETHDAGQDPQRGGLLVAPVGKGAYIYCALALYRQLPEAVPGAYRLFANLLSYAKNPERQAAAGASH